MQPSLSEGMNKLQPRKFTEKQLQYQQSNPPQPKSTQYQRQPLKHAPDQSATSEFVSQERAPQNLPTKQTRQDKLLSSKKAPMQTNT